MKKTIYVKTGHPCQKAPAPVMFVALVVSPGEEIRAAKLHRKEEAKQPGHYGMAVLAEVHGFRLVPSDLYWAIFENKDDEKPIFASDNYFWRQDKGELS